MEDKALWIEWLNLRDKIASGHLPFEKCMKNVQDLQKCRHEEAKWLFNKIGHCKTREEVLAALSSEDDPRSLVYRCVFLTSYPKNLDRDAVCDMMKRSADAGNSLAQTLIACRRDIIEIPEAIEYAKLGAAQGERDCYHFLSKQIYDAKESGRCCFQAAELDHLMALRKLCIVYLDDNSLLMIRYLCKLFALDGKRVSYDVFMKELQYHYWRFQDKTIMSGEFIYELSKGVDDAVLNFPNESVKSDFNFMVEGVRKWVREWRQNMRNAINAWTLCAKRLGLYKDIHLMISRMLHKDFVHYFSRMITEK